MSPKLGLRDRGFRKFSQFELRVLSEWCLQVHNTQSLWLTKMDRQPRTRQTAGDTQAQRYENISQAEQSRRPPEWEKERRWVWERQAQTVKGSAVPLNSVSSMGAELKLGITELCHSLSSLYCAWGQWRT